MAEAKKDVKPTYVGTLTVEAWPQGRLRMSGEGITEGYQLKLPNGIFTWIDKETFEQCFTRQIVSLEE